MAWTRCRSVQTAHAQSPWSAAPEFRTLATLPASPAPRHGRPGSNRHRRSCPFRSSMRSPTCRSLSEDEINQDLDPYCTPESVAWGLGWSHENGISVAEGSSVAFLTARVAGTSSARGKVLDVVYVCRPGDCHRHLTNRDAVSLANSSFPWCPSVPRRDLHYAPALCRSGQTLR